MSNRIKGIKSTAKDLSDRDLQEYLVAYLKGIHDDVRWIKGYLIATIVIAVIVFFMFLITAGLIVSP